jgi:hypothetical protein
VGLGGKERTRLFRIKHVKVKMNKKKRMNIALIFTAPAFLQHHLYQPQYQLLEAFPHH